MALKEKTRTAETHRNIVSPETATTQVFPWEQIREKNIKRNEEFFQSLFPELNRHEKKSRDKRQLNDKVDRMQSSSKAPPEEQSKVSNKDMTSLKLNVYYRAFKRKKAPIEKNIFKTVVSKVSNKDMTSLELNVSKEDYRGEMDKKFVNSFYGPVPTCPEAWKGKESMPWKHTNP